MSGSLLLRLTPLLLLVTLVACSGNDGVRIAPVADAEPTATPARESRPTPPPQPPAMAIHTFRPADGYTSMIADRRGVYWLGGGDTRQAAVVTAGHDGANERVIARPRPDEALGRPLPAGDWVVFPETQAAPVTGGPWRLRAVNVLDGRERIVDQAADGWEGLSLAVSGTRVVYTVGMASGPEGFSEVRVWDSVDDSRRISLRTAPGVTLQRIAYDGQSAAAVRTSRGADGAVVTDVVELDLLGGQVLALNAVNATLPAIAPRWIVWVTIPIAGQPNQVVLFDRQVRTRRVVAASGPGRSFHNPSITGNLVTWNASDTSEINVYDAVQRAAFTLDRGSSGKVWAYDGTLIWTAWNQTAGQYEMRVGVMPLTP